MIMVVSFTIAVNIPFTLLYVYCFLNLYTGRKTEKYKPMMVMLNMILFIAYIFIITTIQDYNSALLIIGLIVILIVIVLALVGSIAYDVNNTINRVNSYRRPLLLLRNLCIVSTTVVIFIFVSGFVMTGKTVKRLDSIDVLLQVTDENMLCDSSLLLMKNDRAELLFSCDIGREMFYGAKEIEIRIDDKVIYSISIDTQLKDLTIHNFPLMFEQTSQLITEESIFNIDITYEDTKLESKLEVSSLQNRFKRVRVPLWGN